MRMRTLAGVDVCNGDGSAGQATSACGPEGGGDRRGDDGIAAASLLREPRDPFALSSRRIALPK